MSSIPVQLRRSVVQRARGRCEYCGLNQKGQEATFHIDHVVPVVKGGATNLNNLALACVSCSLRKGDRQAIIDPESAELVPFYNPRRESWNDHFEWQKFLLIGRTAIGRATTLALRLNRADLVNIRREQMRLKRFPSKD